MWLKAYRRIAGFRCESSFYAWLYRMVSETVIIDLFRKQQHETEPLHLIDEGRITATAACPSVYIERGELREHLREAIADLPPMRRRVFCLYYHHELPIKAIATRLNRSEGTIKTHLRNARLDPQERLSADLLASEAGVLRF